MSDNSDWENEKLDGVYGLTNNSDLISTTLIKLKIQGKESDIQEFKKRFKKQLDRMDCQVLDEKPSYRNRDSEFFRTYTFIGMNRRKRNGE